MIAQLSCVQLCDTPAGMPVATPPPAGLPPPWAMLQEDPQPLPAFCSNDTHPQVVTSTYWGGVIAKLEGLLECCQPRCSRRHAHKAGRCHWTIKQYTCQWQGVAGSSQHPASHLPLGCDPEPGTKQPYTGCILALNVRRALPPHLKLKLHSKAGRRLAFNSPNYSYIKLKAGGLDVLLNKEFYLHTLLCYLYRGAAPAAGYETGHMCQHKCCIAPWHLDWMTKSMNRRMYIAHKKQLDYTPPSAAAASPSAAAAVARRRRAGAASKRR